MVALLDFEKAFDRVDHSYLLTVLRHSGFPQVVVDMVRVLYSDLRSKILVNGHLSKSPRQGDEKGRSKGPASKPASQNTPKVSKHRDSGGHAVNDDEIARCEAVAKAFCKNPGDVNSFLDQILVVPSSQVYELTIKLDKSLRGWSYKVFCSQFVKENPGSLWGSKFPELLIHKKNPTTMVISCYDPKTCVAMGGTKLGEKDYQVPQYTRYGSNYYVTFTKVNNNDMARAIVANLACLTMSVITAFNPTAD
ncbi:Aste57867_22152 [Aphanomyces stellatus]|uniref:Aste57867_22152 protein n=1 Tax=Aphanomyces stellatus TaxID=120398 RepID=A0A485LPD6_9STRA|nr:hypothetical protein As57867_022083 [Aphanomyces stellatus]VFT98819.1 Aste57867_22152 [Aphanomyces stellatus]